MGNRKALSALAILLGISFVAPARAEETWESVKPKLREAIKQATAQIETAIPKRRSLRCPLQTTEAARQSCIAAYEVIIAKVKTERAELELELAAADLADPQRDAIREIIVADYEKLEADTIAIVDPLESVFPFFSDEK